MFKNNFIVVIKNNGRILRENNGVVRLPFGSDYTIMLKNKESRKAVANIEIDGEDVATGIIVPANESVEIKGALDGMQVNNHFRFIKKTQEISNYRGDRPDDGLVRVEFRFEQENIVNISTKPIKKKCRDYPAYDWSYTNDGTSGGWDFDNNTTVTAYYTNGAIPCNNLVSDVGITVAGKETRQDFVYGSTKPLEIQSHVIVLQLRGLTKQRKRIKKAITVKTRLKCSTCGRKSRSNAKFCGNCGTYLK
jgi:hypothetical protein